MRQPTQVLIYAVRPVGNDWEYLLLRRVRERFWQGGTGGVEGEEDIAQAAARELFEETHLVPSTLQRVDYSYSFPVADEWRHLYAPGVEEILEYVFVVYVDGQQEPIISSEHDRWQWCRFDAALELLSWPENVEALKRCDRVIRARG